MKVGISSAVFYPLEAEYAIEKCLKLGFRELEYFFNCDYEMSFDFVSVLSERLGEYNSKLISVHPYTAFAEGVFFFSEYMRRSEENIIKYSECFKTAKLLGANYFTFHGDRAYGGISDAACALSDRGCIVLQKLAKAAKDRGVTLCLENVSWCKSANINYLRTVAENVDDIGFTLDLKQARRAGISVDEYLNVMGNRIKNIHISDFDEGNDCLLPGEGIFDFENFIKKLNLIDYRGDLIIEVYSSNYEEESQILRSKQFLEEIIRK